MLEALDAGNVEEAIGAHLELAALPETAESIARACGLEEGLVADALAHMGQEARVATVGKTTPLYARPALLQKLTSALERAMLEFHSKNPQATGLSKKELRQKTTPAATAACFDAIVEEAARRGAIALSNGEISHPKASAGARKIESDAAEAIADALQKAAGTPPDLGALATDLGVELPVARKAVQQLERDGRIVRITGDRFYAADVIEQYRADIRAYLEEHGQATAADLKDVMGTTRKYAVPILEYFDNTSFTRRVDDMRTLAK